MKRTSLWLFSPILAMILALGLACVSKPDDAKVSSEIQNKFGQDSGLSTKQLKVQANGGVVTCSGNVDNDAQREAAGRQAALGQRGEDGHQQLAGSYGDNVRQRDSAPGSHAARDSVSSFRQSGGGQRQARPGKKTKAQSPKTATKANDSGQDSSMGAMNGAVNDGSQPASPANQDNTTATSSNNPPDTNQPASQEPPPPPVPRKLIIDQGTQVTVRLINPIDSEKNQTGDTFHATLNTALTSDGEEAVPAGTELTGHLVSVKSAGKFAGQSEVVLQLDSLQVGQPKLAS